MAELTNPAAHPDPSPDAVPDPMPDPMPDPVPDPMPDPAPCSVPDVSVVVVGEGEDASAVRRTLDSIAGQTLGAVEAVPPPASPGRPAGTYVMFVEAGRVLEPFACLTLFAAAEREKAQLVSACAAAPSRKCRSGLHERTAVHRGAAERPAAEAAAACTPAVRLYRREFLTSIDAWPVDAASAARAYEAAGILVELPHRVLRPAPASRRRRPLRRLRKAAGGPRLKRAVYRRVLTRLPVRKGSIVFESRGGRYAGSPRALYEHLRATGHRGRMTWVHAGGGEEFPGGVRLVRRSSWAYYRALARAEFWIDDDRFPAHLAKRPQTTYVHLLAAPPLEFTGLDEPGTKLGSRAARRRLRRSVDRYDHIVVGSDYDAAVVRRALRPRAELLPLGRPRNDGLVRGGDPARLERLRAELGLGRPGTTVLYAPAAEPAPGLDLDLLARRLGPDFTLLARCPSGGAAVDASAVRDETSLLLLADVLVTDHAPAMFDFALLDRPMVFHLPGVAERLRRSGSYFDLVDEAPGPRTLDADALVEAIRGHVTSREVYREARQEFARRHGQYEKGEAAAAIAERFFGRAGR
ncbi:CDP-glycerol glycerophosphotransferase family protein [Spirillospora sp. NPDC047279]|uniref:CDP-glycerol glycerophosphotransferase family protein n=1 Tax=Spirillospora sp. NPDC047279 TaxID=3155478 RepID=UPI0034077ADB